MPYAEDLAAIHDMGFSDFAERATDEVLRLLAAARIDSGRVIDLGCGAGHTARRLLDAGYEVCGWDLSADMISLARSRAPEADLRVGSFVDAELPDCVAVTALGEVLNYMLDEAADARALHRLFERVYAALRPGGLFVLDVLGPGQLAAREESRHRVSDVWAVLVDAHEDRDGRLLTREITTFRKVEELYRRDFEVHRQRLVDPGALAAELRGIGFRVRVRRGYGTFRLRRAHRVLIARKAGA